MSRLFGCGRFLNIGLYIGLGAYLLFAFLRWSAILVPIDLVSNDNLNPEGYKLHVIFDPPDAVVDVVAVHGMDGHWRRSWTADNDIFWLQDLLPRELPRARILSFGYDSRTTGGHKPLTLDIIDHGKDLLSDLGLHRRLTQSEKRPLLFIGHSLGGLVIKAALVHSDMARDGHLEWQRSIKLSTYAVLFFGTPHQGGKGTTLLTIIRQIDSITSYTNLQLLEDVSIHSDILGSLQERYNPISSEFETVFFYEREAMSTKLGSLIIVPKFSAVVGGSVNTEDVGLAADHTTLVKYRGKTDPNFDKVLLRLQIMVRYAEHVVCQKWVHYGKTKATKQYIMLDGPRNEHLKITQDQVEQPAWPSHLEEYRVGIQIQQLQNQQFVGRKQTLQQMHNILQPSQPKKSSSRRLRVVVLHGLGGVGKTQLALEYAYSRGATYSTVLWLDGSSRAMAISSIHRHLESILSHYISIGLVQGHPSYIKIKQAADDTNTIRTAAKSRLHTPDNEEVTSNEQQILLDAFLAWLSHEENTNWLLVIDNVDDLETFDFRKLLPRVPWGNVVITSRRSDLAIRWDSIEVLSMDENEAMQLLMSSTKLSLQPGSKDWEDGLTLVNSLGYLPLAIVQAGSLLAVQLPPDPMSYYLELLQEVPGMALGYKSAPAVWDYRNETALTTWEISFQAVQQEMPKAAHILQICAFLNREYIAQDFFVIGAQSQDQSHKAEVAQSFSLLMAYSLVQRTSGEPGFTLHPVVHKWARLRLDAKDKELLVLEALQMLSQYEGAGGYRYTHYLEIMSFLETEYSCRPEDFLKENPVGVPPTWDETLLATWYWASGHWEAITSYIYDRLHVKRSFMHSVWPLMEDARIDWFIKRRVDGWIACQASVVYGSSWHPKALYWFGNYAFAADSYDWYQWLLPVRQLVFGQDHPSAAGALMGLARFAKWCDAAAEFSLEAFRIRYEQLGPDDILTQNSVALVREMGIDCPKEGYTAFLQWYMADIEHQGGLAMMWNKTVDWLWPMGFCDLAVMYLKAGVNNYDDGARLLLHAVTMVDNCIKNRCKYPWTFDALPPSLLGDILDSIDKFAWELSQSVYIVNLVTALDQQWQALAVDAKSKLLSKDIADGATCGSMSIATSLVVLHVWMDDLDGASIWFSRFMAAITPGWTDRGLCLYSTPDAESLFTKVTLSEVVFSMIFQGGPWNDHESASSLTDLITTPLLIHNVELGYKVLLSGEEIDLCPIQMMLWLKMIQSITHRYLNSAWQQALTIFTQQAKELHGEDESPSCFSDLRRVTMCPANVPGKQATIFANARVDWTGNVGTLRIH